MNQVFRQHSKPSEIVLCYSAKIEIIQEEEQRSWSRPLGKLLGHLIMGGSE